MVRTMQSSLFDAIGEQESGFRSLDALERTVLGEGAWIDVLPCWLAGAETLFDRLVREVPWREERRRMYDRTVAVPRLLCHYGEHDPLPHPTLSTALSALDAHYLAELGEPFRTAGLCYYRDGRDSVAWHGDTIGRGAHQDTMVAILSLGAPRTLALRSKRGGPTVRRALGHGDLIVMGGTCQRTWEHAIGKTAKPVGSRISVQFRPRDVR